MTKRRKWFCWTLFRVGKLACYLDSTWIWTFRKYKSKTGGMYISLGYVWIIYG